MIPRSLRREPVAWLACGGWINVRDVTDTLPLRSGKIPVANIKQAACRQDNVAVILQQAASGERDLNRLKSSAFEKLGAAA
jgi:hypothetical protein